MKKRLITILAVALMTLGASGPAFASSPQTGVDAFCDNAADLVTSGSDYCNDD